MQLHVNSPSKWKLHLSLLQMYYFCLVLVLFISYHFMVNFKLYTKTYKLEMGPSFFSVIGSNYSKYHHYISKQHDQSPFICSQFLKSNRLWKFSNINTNMLITKVILNKPPQENMVKTFQDISMNSKNVYTVKFSVSTVSTSADSTKHGQKIFGGGRVEFCVQLKWTDIFLVFIP